MALTLTKSAAASPGLTDEQRFLFDLQGYLLIPNVLSPDEIGLYKETIYRLSHENRPDADFWDERGEPKRGITVHRPIEKDPIFLDIVDHPSILPLLQQIVGEAPLLIDNDAELSPHHMDKKGWHRGCGTHGYSCEDGRIFCTMAKCIWYLTDVRKGENTTRILPGSHKSKIQPPLGEDSSVDLPGQVELEVEAGTVLLFAEACLHAGYVNPSDKTRVNMYFNYGPSWVQPWEGYRPSARLVEEAEGMRKQILGGGRIYSTSDREGQELYR